MLRRRQLDAAKRFLSSGSSSSPPLSSLSSPSILLDGRHDDAEFLSSQLHSKGFVPTTSQILSLETTAMIKDRMNRLFHGQFDTGVYPDEWHWRAGISKPNVTREICNSWKSDTKKLVNIFIYNIMYTYLNHPFPKAPKMFYTQILCDNVDSQR